MIALLDGCQTASTGPLNLAVSMALHDHRVVLAELYAGRGVVRHYVEIPAGFTLRHLFESNGHSSSTRLSLDPYLLRHISGLAILPAMTNTLPLTANQTRRIVDMLRNGQDYLLVDLAKATEAVKRLVAEMADHILLISEPEQTAIASVGQQLTLLNEWGLVHKASIVTDGGEMTGRSLSRSEIEQEMEGYLLRPGPRVVATIPPAPDLYHRAAQLSLPLVMYDPASAPARAYTELALWLAQQEPIRYEL